MGKRTLARAVAVIGTAGLVMLAAAVPALAHVTAQPGTAAKGGFTVIAFRVPDESETAGTIKLQVNLPADHPITDVRTTPMPGWTAQVGRTTLAQPVTDDDGRKVTEAVTIVTWTAQPGTKIGPNEYADFTISVGPLPKDTDQLVMPAVQTYDDGSVVNWDAPPVAEGAPEPEHPAPLVTLVDDTTSTEHGHDAAAATPAASATDNTARWLGGAALVVGVIGLLLAAQAAARSRRSTSG